MAPASISVCPSTKLYRLVLSHIARTCTNGLLEATITAATGADDDEDEDGHGKKDDDDECGACTYKVSDRIVLSASFGDFTFQDFHGTPMTATHTYLGDPVGTNCDATLYKTLVVGSHAGREAVVALFAELVARSETATAGRIKIFHWHVRHSYWRETSRIKARSLASVILPAATISKVLDDVDSFVAPETKKFYERHGIPYRRSYLFYGVPGAGKTSFIQALAGAYKRSVAYLTIDPQMTDDGLRQAMDTLPASIIVVLEDVDALFGKDRTAKRAQSALTFSGLLNALDGVGASSGQMYILTTNLRDDLDPALVRNGRVDCQVRFDHATDEQIEKMWSAFYPPDTVGEGECKSEAAAAAAEGPGLAKAFCAAVRASLGGRPVACCALQHFFVTQRRRTATEALAAVGELVDDLRRREAEDAADQADKGEGEGEGEGEGKGKGPAGAAPGGYFVSPKGKKKGK